MGSRRVTHDGLGGLRVRFPFDRSLVERIKTLPHRRWIAAERYWWVPAGDVAALVDLLAGLGFEFDGPTRDLYRSAGGTASLDGGPRDEPQPGLFDEPRGGEETHAGDYTVSRLNERAREALESAFPAPVWIVGEIAGFNKNAHRKHVSFELVEREDDGRTISRISATLFEGTRRELDRLLRRAGEPFRLEDEISVRLQARVELYVPWGSYRVVVESLDVAYTLGEAARRREEIVRRLTAAGLVGINVALPLPPLPLRVGLITSLGSDAYNDVLRSLQESRFAFRVTAHGARVQGRATEPSVLNALDWFRARADRFDVVLICRGGGSRTDLVWFDSEPLGRAVAGFPLPVLVGIGHEQDVSVLDAVARSFKTPTAAAGFLVQTVADSLERLETAGRRVLEAAAAAVRDERRRGAERAGRLARAARVLLQNERTHLQHRRRRTVLGARRLLAAARERLGRWTSLIPRGASLQIDHQQGRIRGASRSIRQAARRDLDTARRRLDRMAAALGPRCRRRVGQETERLDGRDRRLRSLDPRRVVERGYAILRHAAGGVLTDASAAPAGARLSAELRRGVLRLRSEGAVETPNDR